MKTKTLLTWLALGIYALPGVSAQSSSVKNHKAKFDKIKNMNNPLVQDAAAEKLKSEFERHLKSDNNPILSSTYQALCEYDDIEIDPNVYNKMSSIVTDLESTIKNANYSRSTRVIDKTFLGLQDNLEVINNDENFARPMVSLTNKINQLQEEYLLLTKVKEWSKNISLEIPYNENSERQYVFINANNLNTTLDFIVSKDAKNILKKNGFKDLQIEKTGYNNFTFSFKGSPKEYVKSLQLPLAYTFEGKPENFPNQLDISYVIGQDPKIIAKQQKQKQKEDEKIRKQAIKALEKAKTKQDWELQRKKEQEKKIAQQNKKRNEQHIKSEHTKKYGLENDYYSFKIRPGVEMLSMWDVADENVVREDMKVITAELSSYYPSLASQGFDVFDFQFERQNYDKSRGVPKSTPESFAGPSLKFDYKQVYLKGSYLWNIDHLFGDDVPFQQGKVTFQGLQGNKIGIEGTYDLRIDIENIARASLGTRTRTKATPVGFGLGAEVLFMKETLERNITYNSSATFIENYKHESKFNEVRAFAEMGLMVNHFELNCDFYYPVTKNKFDMPMSVSVNMGIYLF